MPVALQDLRVDEKVNCDQKSAVSVWEVYTASPPKANHKAVLNTAPPKRPTTKRSTPLPPKANHKAVVPGIERLRNRLKTSAARVSSHIHTMAQHDKVIQEILASATVLAALREDDDFAAVSHKESERLAQLIVAKRLSMQQLAEISTAAEQLVLEADDKATVKKAVA